MSIAGHLGKFPPPVRDFLRLCIDCMNAVEGPAPPTFHWKKHAWWFGLAMLAALVLIVTHESEAEEFVQVAEQAQPGWFFIAVALQACTYFASGKVLQRVVSQRGHQLQSSQAAALSLMKLFLDQALPSGGLSGTYWVAQSLQRKNIPRGVVSASLVVDTTSFYLAYVLCLLAAMAWASHYGEINSVWFLAALAFFIFAATVSVLMLRLSGRPHNPHSQVPKLLRPLERLIHFIRQADAKLARNPKLLLQTTALQLVVFGLDATTLWVLLLSLGHYAAWTGVFESFMLSSLLRTVGFIPGGLGTFEAASVVTLHFIGVSTPVALTGTLLFRGLSFWLPMAPGLWLARRAMAPTLPRHPTSLGHYWAMDEKYLREQLQTSEDGLSNAEAQARLEMWGRNTVADTAEDTRWKVLWNQLRSPLLLLLVFAAVISGLTEQVADTLIVGGIIIATVAIGYSREAMAQTALVALRSKVATQACVVREGQTLWVPITHVVPGDVVWLSAGNVVPADCVVLAANSCQVSEAVLTGESYPVEKMPDVLDLSTPLPLRRNCLFMGTNVQSGEARALVVATGKSTQFGHIASRLALRAPLTEFERGVHRFGYLLTSAMLVMVLLVFAAHMWAGRPVVETFLFAIALAVGLSPELLPAILTVNLARGATAMAQQGVLVRRLNAIENLGSMDVLCTDKTGTLTEGVVDFSQAYDVAGNISAEVLAWAAVNAHFEKGLSNPLDVALKKALPELPSDLEKKASLPFDSVRKRVSVVVKHASEVKLICKGAFPNVLEVCRTEHDGIELNDPRREKLLSLFETFSNQGFRVLAVATKSLEDKETYSREDESDLRFEGFLTFFDAPKEGAKEAIAELSARGVTVKLITGDNSFVSKHVAELVGLPTDNLLRGRVLQDMTDEALWQVAEKTHLFVEVDPNQKERILRALRRKGHVVGFLGDGINDAPAMHAADTSLSVEKAVDVAKASADFVLTERHLDVIKRGIDEGRKTFANTLKYVLTTTSANLGNMASMAVASLFLPFLPLTAGQILLNNFVSDIPAVGIAEDSVDAEMVQKPRRWDMRFIARFMLEFGFLSSAFDLLTFGMLLFVLKASPAMFQTGWFVESLLTELGVALIVRTRRRFFQSRPGNILLGATLILIPVAIGTPFIPGSAALGFVPLPWIVLASVCGISVLYFFSAEILKAWFYRHVPLE